MTWNRPMREPEGRTFMSGRDRAAGGSALRLRRAEPERPPDALDTKGDSRADEGGEQLPAVVAADVNADDGSPCHRKEGMVPNGATPVLRERLLERLDADHRQLGYRKVLAASFRPRAFAA